MMKRHISSVVFSLFLIALAIISLNMNTGCTTGSPGGSAGFNALPAHDYNIVFSVDFGSMNSSSSMKRITELLDMDEFRTSTNVLKEQMGLDLWETASLAIALRLDMAELMAGRVDEFILVWQGPGADEASGKLADYVETLYGKPVERSEGNYSTFTFGPGNTTIAIAAENNALYIGEKDDVDDALAVARGEKASFATTPAVREFATLLNDGGAQVLGYAADLKSIFALAAFAPNASNPQMKMMLEKDIVPESGAISVSFTEDLVMHHSAIYSDSEKAARAIEIGKTMLANPLAGADLGKLKGLLKNPEDIEKMMGLIPAIAESPPEMTQRGNAVDTTWHIKGDSPTFDAILTIVSVMKEISVNSWSTANHRAKQTTTVANLQKLGQSVEQYIMDHNRVGSPKCADVHELQTLLKMLEINENDSMKMDGWGNLFIYEADMTPGSKSYRITSYGADAAPGPEPTTTGIVTRFIEDIIYENGNFRQRPEGSQR